MWPANTAFSPCSSPLGTFRQRLKRRGACKQALLFGRAKQAVRERASDRAKPRGAKEILPRPAPLSRLLSHASRASTFHDIPQIESLLAGYEERGETQCFL